MESQFIQTLTLISGFLYIFGQFSLFIKERLYISESLVSTVFGMLIKNIIAPMEYNNTAFHMQLSRLVISLQVVAVGIYVPHNYARKQWVSLFVILVPLMIMTYITSAFIICVCTGLTFQIALIIAACVTPTDPVLATTVLKGKFANRYIPSHLRNLLTIESGANDGLGYILLTFPMIFIDRDIKRWLLDTWLYEIIFSIFLGACIGYAARKMIQFSKSKNLIDKENLLVSMIILGLFVTGITAYLKSDDILACFVCGMFFSGDDSFKKDIADSHLLEVIDLLFNHVFFIFFGASISFSDYKIVYFVIALLLLAFRRLPFFFLLSKCIPQLKNYKEVFFAGFFGPIGVGAIFFGFHAVHMAEGKINDKDLDQIMKIIKVVVLCSIVTHGLTAPIMNFHLKRRRKRDVIAEEAEASESNYSNFNE